MPELRHYNPTWLSQRPIAHRGLHGPGVPENSLAAFQAAAAAGYAIELDVRLSADGQLVVIHDPNTKRLTRRSLVVADTPAATLTQLQISGTSQRIPLLTDVFKVVRGRVPLLIEIKHHIKPGRICPGVVSLINNYPGEVAIESFDPRTVMWFRLHAGHVPRGQLTTTRRATPQPRWYRTFSNAMPLNLLASPQFLAADVGDQPKFSLKFWQFVLKVPVLVWVVKTKRDFNLADRADYNIIFERLRPPLRRR